MGMQAKFQKLIVASLATLAVGAFNVACSGDTNSQDVNVMNARREAQIWTTYALNPYLRAYIIEVSVHDGKALLRGNVDGEFNKDLAAEIALGVEGVTQVDNQILGQTNYVAPARTPGSKRSYGAVIDDAMISAEISSKLLWSRYSDGLTIYVETSWRRVSLTGHADSAQSRDLVGRLAINTRGVEVVENRLIVDNSAASDGARLMRAAHTAQTIVEDSWITSRVGSTLMYSTNVGGSDIAVNTSGGIVTLDGKVSTAAQREFAIEFANNVRGVKSVQANALRF